MLGMKARKLADDIWKQLGITQTDANKDILSSFKDGHFLYYGAKYARDIATGNRVGTMPN